jgi:hypothetical protein
MGYCLFNKFRGAWLGSLMGQKLANYHQPLFLPWSNQTKASFEQEKDNLLDILGDNTAQITSDKLILSLLPAILYYHDDWFTLSAVLTQKIDKLSQSRTEIDNILIWCYVVRLALRGEIVSHGLTNQVVIGTGLKQTPAIKWLKQVELSNVKGFSSIHLIENLSFMDRWEIPLSLFCFLNNLADFSLTIQQSLSIEKILKQKTNLTALTGVLSGAYNGWAGISIKWRIWLQNQDFYPQINFQIEKLIKEWLGGESLSNTQILSSVISSPKILQLRPDLKIISQQEY